jgi:hypothetical protein
MFKRLLTMAVALAMVLTLALPGLTLAATTNPSPGSPGYIVLPITMNRQYTATTASVFKTKLPFPCALINVYATARASGGTTPTLTVNVLEGGSTVLSAPISITAGTVSEGTITDSSLADEAVITVDLAIGGTSPTWDDIDVVLVLKRL